MKKIISVGLPWLVACMLLTGCQTDKVEHLLENVDDADIEAAWDTASTTFSSAKETADKIAEKAQEASSGLQEELPGVIENATEMVSNLTEEYNKLESKVNEASESSEETVTGLEEVQLVYVVDGDTLVVVGADSLEYKVRLIGIDTPESVHSDASKNNVFGENASDHTKEILKDVDTLYLEYDKQVTDKYNRTLAYVWFSEDTSDINNMLNARILSDGFAVDKVYEPNHKYADKFATLCEEAIASHAGLWVTEGYHTLTGR